MSDLASLAAEAVKDDEELKQRVHNLVSDMLDTAEDLMETGTPQIKLAIIKSTIPTLVRELREKGESDDAAILREEMRQLAEELRSQVRQTGTEPLPDAPAPQGLPPIDTPS